MEQGGQCTLFLNILPSCRRTATLCVWAWCWSGMEVGDCVRATTFRKLACASDDCAARVGVVQLND
eukprot:11078612-Lingulodinium_polyedra.AAC.1